MTKVRKRQDKIETKHMKKNREGKAKRKRNGWKKKCRHIEECSLFLNLEGRRN